LIKNGLIIGDGFLGSYLKRKLDSLGYFSILTTHKNIHESNFLDVTNLHSIEKIIEQIKPEFMINCAAKTQVDFLETHPNIAYAVNSQGPENIAKLSKKYGIRLIHISTDSVFDGKKGMYAETDKPNPINVYAKSKLLGEKNIQKHSDNFVIIRTNFYGYNPNNSSLFNWILNSLNQGEKIIGYSDVFFNPVEISNLCELIVDIEKSNYNGILHVSSDKPISKYEFILEIATNLGYDTNLIFSDSIDNYDLVAKRPKNTSLNNKKFKQNFSKKIIPMKNWLINQKNLHFSK
jgi:dTDP-4-dehydrorhamnose reductase